MQFNHKILIFFHITLITYITNVYNITNTYSITNTYQTTATEKDIFRIHFLNHTMTNVTQQNLRQNYYGQKCT